MKNKNILISGAGIAGTALAYWLKKFGFNPTIIEEANDLREGGYVIDFVGAGFDVAEKMGILPDLKITDVKIKELVFVDKNGSRKGSLNSFRMRSILNNRYLNLFRSDLAKVIYNHLDKDIEFIFGDSITHIEQNADGILTTFKSGKVRSFDLVIGADGLHSNVRSLMFGDETNFEKYFGYYVAAFTIGNYLSRNCLIRSDNSYFSYTLPGKQVDIYSMSEDKLTTLFVFSSDQKLNYNHHNIDEQKKILRNEFRNVGWENPSLLERLDSASDFYFDSVSQIRMEHWSEGRVSLLGDAAFAPSLLAGQGSSLAMVAAYILAGELRDAGGNYERAFQQYEKIFKPFIDYKQNVAKSFAHTLVPHNSFSIWIRRVFSNVILSSFLAKRFVKKYMTDNIVLKEYSGAEYNKLISTEQERNISSVLK